jgi:outer membrane protein assembly factor BamA
VTAGLAQAISKPYRTLEKISLDIAAADALVAPGYGAAQGAQFLLSDLLGDHILFASVSAAQMSRLSNLADSFSGGLLYLNLEHRLNWGAGLFRFQGRFRDVLFDIYDEASYGAQFVASYPFSRFRRVELQLAVQRSDRVDVEDAWDDGIFGGGSEQSRATRDLTRSGTLSSNFVSYVKDNTLWLSTGPIDGERLNVSAGLISCFACEVPSPVTDQPVRRPAAAEYFVLLGDYRRYFRTSLQSAYAVKAYGYFSDGAIPGRSALGGPNRLRGYPYLSLAGSRVWLVNQEWRFPILNRIDLAFPFGSLRLPGIQGATFFDAGSSWLKDEKMRGIWGSYGLGFRTSLGAPLVLRLDVGKRYASNEAPPVVFRGGERFNDTFVDFFFGFNF